MSIPRVMRQFYQTVYNEYHLSIRVRPRRSARYMKRNYHDGWSGYERSWKRHRTHQWRPVEHATTWEIPDDLDNLAPLNADLEPTKDLEHDPEGTL